MTFPRIMLKTIKYRLYKVIKYTFNTIIEKYEMRRAQI